MKLKKLISIWDCHIPEHINLNPLCKFIKDFKPDYFIIGGDFLDLAYFSDWAQMKPENIAGDKFRKDLKIANKFLDFFDKYAKKKYYIEGNHEYRLFRFIEKFPYLRHILDLRRELHLKERGWKWISFNQVLKIGKLYFTHGHYTTKYHANKHLTTYGKNIRYGHIHDYQVYSQVLPIDFHRRLGIALPCLCHINPEYMRGRPNKWVNGFHYAYLEDTGIFYEFVPIIQGNGKFVAEGKLYV